jgi:predicted transcriptional regulator
MITDQTRRLLLSVKPRFAAAILDGSKTVELRRTRPRIEVPTEALIYSSSPERALIGTCDVVEVMAYTPRGMWQLVGQRTGVTYPEFQAYFVGCDTAYGLVLRNAQRLRNEVSLQSMRTTWNSFQPPQSFRYLTRSASDLMLSLTG